jgi:N-formylglutamate amidohydrolase
MKQGIILHIPHSATIIPYRDGYTISNRQLEEEQILLTDWYTDDLFIHEDAIPIIAGFSRLFCDVERFSDDSKEVMSKVGMGVLYERCDDGTFLRTVTPELRAKIIEDFYEPHHQSLTEAVEYQLEQFGKALILDCHSFPDTPFKRDLDRNINRPDFNIGTDSFHTPKKLLEAAEQFFTERNFSIKVDKPYSGSMVPLKYYQKNTHVQSIMLEINRKLYLQNNSNQKSENYLNVKETVRDFIGFLSDFYL